MGNGMTKIGTGISFLSDAKDPDQLGRNKITHIISIHESPQPLLQQKALQRMYQLYPLLPPQWGELPCALVS
uniref:Dual specificity phosphatase 15 n=1 Tax=Canis lupus dingo TaxID=286419 RepID=A0A8C0JSR6_CANLU